MPSDGKTGQGRRSPRRYARTTIAEVATGAVGGALTTSVPLRRQGPAPDPLLSRSRRLNGRSEVESGHCSWQHSRYSGLMLTALRLRMIAIAIIVLVVIVVPIWNVLTPHTSIESLRSLDGCYEGEGLPDFMRPPRHWSLRIANGTLINRAGAEIAKIRLGGSEDRETPVVFSPGILVAGRPATVMAGDTVAGKAYLNGSRATIVLADELRQVLSKTTCS